jgi:RNA polymerase sigma factor (sigma-70 family)
MNVGMHATIRELGTLFNEGAIGLLSDGQLLDRFVERRDAPAFEAIVERYAPLVWGVCRRVLLDHHDAQDAFQATFLVLARKAASVMPREKLGNWLYGVAFQTAMKARATRAKRRVRERPACEMTEPEAVPDEPKDELLSRLDREVTRLPEKYRMPIILCELEGKTHRQAAEQLGWPVGTVSSRLSRARALLASRLSRHAAPLTVGALAGLLTQDMARAGVPPELVHSTAKAATLSTAAKAVTAGVVSAAVSALTGEVLKTMFLSKLKLATTMLLAVLALAAGGASLIYPAHATPPADQKGLQTPNERPQPAEAAKEDMPRPDDPPREPFYYGGFSFTASPTGNVALAYNPATREVKAVRLNATQGDPIKVTPKVVKGTCVVGLYLEGPKIARVAVFDINACKWSPLDLDEPGSGVVEPMALGRDVVAYRVGGFSYLYSAKAATWDRLALESIVKGNSIRLTLREVPHTGVLGMHFEGPNITRVGVFNLESGKWSFLDLDEPANGVVRPMALGPGAVAYQVGRLLYVYNAETSKWDRLDVDAIDEEKHDAHATKGR